MIKQIAACAAIISLAGCATKSANIQPSYISPVQYQGYDCGQIGAELTRVTQRVNEVSGQQDRNAKNDAIAVGASLIVWPALLFIGGDDQKAEVARLKGEYDALNQAAVAKKCTIAAPAPVPAATTAAKETGTPKNFPK